MHSLLPALVVTLCLVATAYAHARLPRHVDGKAKIALTRSALLLSGTLLGAVFAASYAGTSGRTLIPFLIGFGGAHVPAAVILFLKTAGRMGKS